MNHNAPTPTYGPQFLNDLTSGSTTSLRSPDGHVIVYDFNSNCPNGISQNEWLQNLIPTTTANEWTTEADPEVYQVFYVTSLVVPEFTELGIEFGTVHAAACDEDNAFSMPGSTVENAFIKIGFWNNRPFSLIDLAAHELGHTFLNGFLNYSNLGNRALHEGISDIIGTYIESQIQGNTDWVMFDDEPLIGNVGSTRDLENPRFDCVTTAPEQQHDRGLPIGHWYFLVSQGSQSDGIPALGMGNALNILLESLNLIGRNSDYPDLMEATLTTVLEQFGRCSNEFIAVARAWELICVPTGYGIAQPCSVKICGDNIVCEEAEYLNLCACGAAPEENVYRWTIVGQKSTEYESAYGMEGNHQFGGNCLTLTDFPKYPYYPQFITIKLYSPTLAGLGIQQYIDEKRIKLIDCNNDDPTCAEYNELQNNQNEERENTGNLSDLGLLDKKLRVFDFLGRLVYEGNTSDIFVNKISFHGLAVFVIYGDSGRVIDVKKVFLAN